MTNQLNQEQISTAAGYRKPSTGACTMGTVQTIPAGWLVAYGNAGVRFDTRSEARRYAKDYQKQIARRGGKFKPSISRLPSRVIDTAKGTTL